MEFELTGKVKVIQDEQEFGSGFKKREFVVTVEDGKYPQDINLECVQDKIALIAPLSVGDEVTCTFDIRGNEYKGRYFNNLQCWRMSSVGTAAPQAPVEDEKPPAGLEELEDDIPFSED